MKYVLRVEHDTDAENPLDGDCEWTLIPFSRRLKGAGDPHEYFARSESGEVVPANIGLRSKFRAGLAFALDCYEHGERHFSLRGEGMRCQWDTSDYAGILLWNHSPKELGAKTYAEREASARAAVEIYNAWANGYAYGYILEDLEGEHVDSCFGFFDSQSLTECVGEHLKPGDVVKIVGPGADMIRQRYLPQGVEIVEEFDEEEEAEEAEAWAARC